MYRRQSPHHFFLAECGRCGFAVEGEIRNGLGGWKDFDCNAYTRTCTHRTADGRATMVCPHLRAAKLGAQPLSNVDFLNRMRACFEPAHHAQEQTEVSLATTS